MVRLACLLNKHSRSVLNVRGSQETLTVDKRSREYVTANRALPFLGELVKARRPEGLNTVRVNGFHNL